MRRLLAVLSLLAALALPPSVANAQQTCGWGGYWTYDQNVCNAIWAGVNAGLPVDWAWRVAWCESRFNPNAYRGFGENSKGLYQFVPSTWLATPQGQRGENPYSPYSNALAAAYWYRVAGPGQWACK